MKRIFSLLCLPVFTFSSQLVLASSPSELANCLANAYPQTVKSSGEHITIRNQSIPITFSQESNYFRLLNVAKLGDQFAQKYERGFSVPTKNEDAGRIRFDPFFAAMYGDSEMAVRQNLVKVFWKPANQTVIFNQVNGAASALERVGNELAQDPQTSHYVQKTAGTFNYRFISGTKRRSAHAFGVAIDFTLPNGLGKYWQWSGCQEGQDCAYPKALIQDPVLQKVVQTFEKYGFIWGGKWYHYDSVHFEYRPELLFCK